MKYILFLLVITLSVGTVVVAYGSVSLGRTIYPVPDIDPLELWNMNDVIIDGTVIEKEPLQEENAKGIFSYNIKVNEYFKGKQNSEIIYAKQLSDFPNLDIEQGDNALFYLKKSEEFGFLVQVHSVETFGDCDARSLIELDPVLPNEKSPISMPTSTENYVDPCVASYFSYDPDFFKGVVNGISPLKQLQYGIPTEKTRCYDDLVLIQKYDGSPACVKPESITKLIERGWTNFTIPSFEYVIKKDNVTYGSSYQIVGGLVDEIHYNEDSNSLIISLSESGKGYLQILIQNGVLHPHREASFTYFVLIDGEEVIFEKLSPIILKITFEKGTKLIEIIGVNPV